MTSSVMRSSKQPRASIFTRSRQVFALAIGASLALTACSAAAGDGATNGSGAGEVLVYDGGGAWGEAQRIAYFEPFEKETGIKVVSAVGDAPPALRTTIESGKPSMDVMNIGANTVQEWIDADLLMPIESGSWTSVDPADISPYPVQEYAVPALIYAAQIAYDPELTGGEIADWADYFDVARFGGERTLGEGMNITTGTLEGALLADGVSPDDLYPLDIERAFAKLDELRPHILKFWSSGAESVQLLADGQVAATAAWNGRVAAAQDQSSAIKSTWNQAILQQDVWTIPTGAANVENAQLFIEFASRPDRQAEFASLITYSPTNRLAFDSIADDRQALLPTAPGHVDQTIMSDDSWWGSDSGNGELWSSRVVTLWQEWLAS